MSVLIDTGVLLRAFARTDPNCETVRQAFRQLIRQREELVTTFQNVAEFHNVSTRPRIARGGYGLPTDVVVARLQFIERLCRVQIENQHSFRQWKHLVDKHQIGGVAVHDARLVAMMITVGVSRILTFNDRDFRRYEGDGITVITPQSLLVVK